jgi:hypothetical protein
MRSVVLAFLLSMATAPVQAQTGLVTGGPPAPVAPDVISRDADGHATIRAVRVTAPIKIDGQLDEAAYTATLPFSDFIQSDPQPGEIAIEKSDVWLLFDDQNVYITCRCWETHPERIIANEMRRDTTQLLGGNDNFMVNLDTFHDGRTGIAFGVNPIGGRNDGQAVNGQQYNGDFNPIWDFKVARFEQGWVVEMAIPFKSLRYSPGRTQTWGVVMVRQSKWRNEVSFLTKMPPSRGHRAILETSLGATVVGLEAPPSARHLEIKPYATTNLTTDMTAVPRLSNDVGGDVGVDLKYAVTRNLTADVTVNTDFAQVEADEQQINLTRFSLFFPEKRDFFLENLGMFSFGGVQNAGATAGTSDAPILFYSRRIGLEGSRVVPIIAGGRLTGRPGPFSVGGLNIQSGDDTFTGTSGTNFTVLRVKRDILRKSSVGALFTGRSPAQSSVGENRAYGIDATLGFFANLFIYAYWARSDTEGVTTDNTSARLQLDYQGDRYGVQAEHLWVGDNFNPEVGFVRRDDMRRSFGQFRFSPRPRRFPSIRKFSYTGSLAYIENGAGRLETRTGEAEFGIERQNSDKFAVAFDDVFEFLPRPFRIGPGVTLPIGEYDYQFGRIRYEFGRQRRLSGTVQAEYGTFYDGDKTTISVTGGRVNLTPQLSVEPTGSVNRVALVEGRFTTTLLGSRVTYTMTPMMFVSALIQYNSGARTVSTNARLRWEYRPGSELFVVYNEQRDTLPSGFPDLQNRAVIVKVNRLVRF